MKLQNSKRPSFDFDSDYKSPQKSQLPPNSDPDSELKELKSKLRIMTTKFSNVRKERDTLKKENRVLQNEILELQSNMRHMVPGFNNTTSSFPMLNEIIDKAGEFYKCDCEDLFFEVLGPELSMEGIIYFFRSCFPKLSDIIRTYFASAEDGLKSLTTLDTLEGSIMNVLRKTYQAHWKTIYENCVNTKSLERAVDDIERVLRLGDCQNETNNELLGFMENLAELLFTMHINDPPMRCNWELIGHEVEFNGLLHDTMDGFVRPGDQCLVVLPPVLKITGEILVKASVLHINYELNF